MELHIHTAQIGKYKGPDAVDITVKTGDRIFSPTWALVMASKEGRIDWETYTEQYLELMRDSWRKNPDAWHAMLRRGTVTLLCYCRAGENCHRYLLAEFLRELGGKEGVAVINEGERPLIAEPLQATLF
jgi:uncharacterized protein YeaO (DUF488 family)